MDINDFQEMLKEEEQYALTNLISKMDQDIQNLDNELKEYVAEAKNINISLNPDSYASLLLAKKGIAINDENIKELYKARDELYRYRMLLQYDYKGTQGLKEIRVGLHTTFRDDSSEMYVTSWTNEICRCFILDNSLITFTNISKNRFGDEISTVYNLIVKDEVMLRFTKVIKAINKYPISFDEEILNVLKEAGFFREGFINEIKRMISSGDLDVDEIAHIISDEFLQELLERRTSPEFKNIVFSIQKKQGEIIQAPYKSNMILQGCAGSGKSMIMLHRLPILLYDNPTNLNKSNLYIISPSQMYIQLAEKMRYQLEISDINIGTIEQYYDYCIGKYPGHKSKDYGKINYTSKINSEMEKYVYSDKLVSDINCYFDALIKGTEVPLGLAYDVLGIVEKAKKLSNTYMQKINNRLLEINHILETNNGAVIKYYRVIKQTIDAMNSMAIALKYRKEWVLRAITKKITEYEKEILDIEKEIENSDPEEDKSKIIILNRNIKLDRNMIEKYTNVKKEVDADIIYFKGLDNICSSIYEVIERFSSARGEFENQTAEDIYKLIRQKEDLIVFFDLLYERIIGIDDKYEKYIGSIILEIEKVNKFINVLSTINDNYLDFEYYKKIRITREKLSSYSSKGVKIAYEYIMEKLGVKPDKNGNIKALKCSPYIYLQCIYLFQGIHSYRKETLLAIDEAQSISPEEIRLLKNINGDNVIFNLFGDVFQHIEGTKGIDRWDEYKDIIDYDYYEMKENYRNASQITEYCNKEFNMNMKAINTPGKGVHENDNEDEFRIELIKHFLDDQRVGLGAILVGDNEEARYIMEEFKEYNSKIHDMTGEDFSIHHTRWNVINIDDAKGLEFSSVIVLAGRMNQNQRYIAYTRALDDLYVYSSIIDVSKYNDIKQKEANDSDSLIETSIEENDLTKKSLKVKQNDVKIENQDSAVRSFFEEKGMHIVDNRISGGRLWVVGDKSLIKAVIDEAIEKFNISGKYTSSKEINNKQGWCTKTNK